MKIKACRNCGELFEANTSAQFCSNDCRQSYQKLRKAETDREYWKIYKVRRRYKKRSTLDETLKKCGELGIPYAEYQKQRTFELMKNAQRS